MADRVHVVAVTTPAGTPATAPLRTVLGLQTEAIERVEVVIPAGHAGLTGIALAIGDSRVIPAEGDFITGNDEVISWPVEGSLYQGRLEVHTYNDDVFDHTHHVRVLTTLPAAVARPTPQEALVGAVLGEAGVVAEVGGVEGLLPPLPLEEEGELELPPSEIPALPETEGEEGGV